MLEGSVLVHLLNFIIIKSFCLCDLSWIYLESSLSFHTDFKVSATFRMTQGEETCTMAVSTVEGMSPFPRLAGLHGNVSTGWHQWGDNFWVVPCPRTLAGPGKPLFNPHVPNFLWTGPCWSFWSLVFPFQAPGVFSFVSCSLSFISSWGGLDLSKNPHYRKEKWAIKAIHSGNLWNSSCQLRWLYVFAKELRDLLRSSSWFSK